MNETNKAQIKTYQSVHYGKNNNVLLDERQIVVQA